MKTMANKTRGIVFLMISIVLIGFIAYQVNNYMTQQEQIKRNAEYVNQKLLSAEQHFNAAKNSFDTAANSFNSGN